MVIRVILGIKTYWNYLIFIIDQRTMELGSARDMVRNPEEHLSFMRSPFTLGLARMTLENQRKQTLMG
jgi:hypothetical protein